LEKTQFHDRSAPQDHRQSQRPEAFWHLGLSAARLRNRNVCARPLTT